MASMQTMYWQFQERLLATCCHRGTHRANGRDNPARVVEQPLPKRPVEGLVFIALLFDYIVFKRVGSPVPIIAIDSDQFRVSNFARSHLFVRPSCDGDQRIPIMWKPAHQPTTKSIVCGVPGM